MLGRNLFFAHLKGLLGSDDVREAKVDELDGPVRLTDEDVVCLQVAVDDL